MAQQYQKFTTNKGSAVYPWLNRPDVAFDPEGHYKTSLRMSKDDAQPLMDSVKEVADKEFGKDAAKARLPFKTDPETNEIIVLAKSRYKPKIVDGSGQVIANDNVPPIRGGSTLKLAGSIFPYNKGANKGVSLQLSAVQVIQLSEGAGGTSMFEAEENAWTAPTAANDNSRGGDSDYDF